MEGEAEGGTMSRLDKAKKVIEEYFDSANCGIFDSQNLLGDPMSNVFSENGLKIDICYRYRYFEVFGLTETEFLELEEFYDKLSNEND